MHATVRSIKARAGQVSAVADLIRTEYLPMLDEIDGVVSYTLVETGDDTVWSLGVFAAREAADAANAKAKAWTAERLMALVDSPLSAGAGEVLIAHEA